MNQVSPRSSRRSSSPSPVPTAGPHHRPSIRSPSSAPSSSISNARRPGASPHRCADIESPWMTRSAPSARAAMTAAGRSPAPSSSRPARRGPPRRRRRGRRRVDRSHATAEALKVYILRARERLQAGTARARRRAAERDRSVMVEPAADGIAYLTLYGPAPDLLAIDEALSKAAVAAHGLEGEARCIPALRSDIACDPDRLRPDRHRDGDGARGAGALLARILTDPVTGVRLTMDRKVHAPPRTCAGGSERATRPAGHPVAAGPSGSATSITWCQGAAAAPATTTTSPTCVTARADQRRPRQDHWRQNSLPSGSRMMMASSSNGRHGSSSTFSTEAPSATSRSRSTSSSSGWRGGPRTG